MSYRKRQNRTDDEKQSLIHKIDELRARGVTITAASRQVGIHTSQYAPWKKRLAGQPNGDAREIKPKRVDDSKHLRIENQRLKMIVAEQALDIQALKEWTAR